MAVDLMCVMHFEVFTWLNYEDVYIYCLFTYTVSPSGECCAAGCDRTVSRVNTIY